MVRMQTDAYMTFTILTSGYVILIPPKVGGSSLANKSTLCPTEETTCKPGARCVLPAWRINNTHFESTQICPIPEAANRFWEGAVLSPQVFLSTLDPLFIQKNRMAHSIH